MNRPWLLFRNASLGARRPFATEVVSDPPVFAIPARIGASTLESESIDANELRRRTIGNEKILRLRQRQVVLARIFFLTKGGRSGHWSSALERFRGPRCEAGGERE
jgi:hypothetical protein